MENILEKAVKENGNIELEELSWKQLMALLNAWDTTYAKDENLSFADMVKRCYKPCHWDENANIIYLHKGNMKTTIIPNACYDLDKEEEDIVFDLLKKAIKIKFCAGNGNKKAPTEAGATQDYKVSKSTM